MRTPGSTPTRADLERAITFAYEGLVISDHGLPDPIDSFLNECAGAAAASDLVEAGRWADQAREAFDGERVANPFDLAEYGITGIS